MHDLTEHIMNNVLPDAPVRQWVISPPFELAPLLAVRPKVLSYFVRCFVGAVSKHLKTSAKCKEDERIHTGSIAFIQRFTKTLSIFPHAHVIFVDGVFVEKEDGELVFREVEPPTEKDLLQVGKIVFQKMETYLMRHGYLDEEPTELDALEKWWLSATKESSLIGQRSEKKKFSHGTDFGGFSIHAGVRIKKADRRGREKLVRYAARPPFSEKQMTLLPDGSIRFELRTPTKSGQRQVNFHPVQFLRRIAWQIPPPYTNMVRYFGVFAATHTCRNTVVPRNLSLKLVQPPDETRVYRVPWAILLAKIYDLDAEACPKCGGTLKPVSAVTEKNQAKKAIESGLSVLGATGPP